MVYLKLIVYLALAAIGYNNCVTCEVIFVEKLIIIKT